MAIIQGRGKTISEAIDSVIESQRESVGPFTPYQFNWSVKEIKGQSFSNRLIPDHVVVILDIDTQKIENKGQ